MREHLYCGKRVDNGKWVEGYYFHDIDKRIVTTEADYIIGFLYKDDTIMQNIEVVPETVGEYTGLTDKNGVKIFEGDIVEADGYREVVKFENGCFYPMGAYIARTGYEYDPDEYEVVGNIHDNPELLEGTK